MQSPIDFSAQFICPVCGCGVEEIQQGYTCRKCDKTYPVIAGIPDFRLRSDRYLDLDKERGKALRIAEKSGHGFSAMLDYYYQITDDVPDNLAARYKVYHHNSISQAGHGLDALSISMDDSLLDAGCGTGGAIIAASKLTANIVGADIALRWLVMCKQRLRENGVKATLVCADIEAMPFKPAGFTRILAGDLLENVYSVDRTLVSLEEQLESNGLIWISGNNRYCPGPHPSTRMWAMGYFPAGIRSFVLKTLRGVDSSRFINLLSPLDIVKRAGALGLKALHLSPKMIQNNNIDHYPLFDRLLIGSYIACARIRLLGKIMLLLGPAFELVLCKSGQITDGET